MIKLCAQSPAKPTDEQLLFLKQIGAEYVSVGSTPDLRTAEGFVQIKKRYADAGITVWNIGNTDVHNMPEVTLNLPAATRRSSNTNSIYGISARPESTIQLTPTWATESGAAAERKSEAPLPGSSIWRARTRRAYGTTRSGRSRCPTAANSPKKRSGRTTPTSSSRWLPVAEEAGVRIGIHPDDPPVPVLAGVPRCIFGNFEGYKRALEIANSPNVGICLCCGTWLEGGRQLTGKDPEEMIRYFGAKKIWKIHFRNVSAPLPHFVETFMDNGYYDMYKIMKALRDVNFDGIVILDHSPRLAGGNYAQTAYGFAYMKALLNRANAEAKA